jgi:hypothetical protein
MFAFDRAFAVLGAVMNDTVANVYIPELHRRAERAKSQSERENIEALIEEYKPYADPHTPQGREMAEVAARVVGFTAKKYSGSNADADEAIQQIAGDFYANERMADSLNSFDPKDGPVKMRNNWSSILNSHSEYVFRELDRKSLQKKKMVMRDDEGEESDDYRNVPSAEESNFEEVIMDMKDYVHRHGLSIARGKKLDDYKAEIAIEIFDIFLKVADKTRDLNVDSGKVKAEWERMRAKKGEKASRSLFYEGWKTMAEIIKAFLIEEKRHGRAAGKTAAERVANAEFRCRLAKWILGE